MLKLLSMALTDVGTIIVHLSAHENTGFDINVGYLGHLIFHLSSALSPTNLRELNFELKYVWSDQFSGPPSNDEFDSNFAQSLDILLKTLIPHLYADRSWNSFYCIGNVRINLKYLETINLRQISVLRAITFPHPHPPPR